MTKWLLLCVTKLNTIINHWTGRDRIERTYITIRVHNPHPQIE